MMLGPGVHGSTSGFGKLQSWWSSKHNETTHEITNKHVKDFCSIQRDFYHQTSDFIQYAGDTY
jgi:hypothetical protein